MLGRHATLIPTLQYSLQCRGPNTALCGTQSAALGDQQLTGALLRQGKLPEAVQASQEAARSFDNMNDLRGFHVRLALATALLKQGETEATREAAAQLHPVRRGLAAVSGVLCVQAGLLG